MQILTKSPGDPEDRTLRKVEREVLVPKIMRDRAKKEKCVDEVAAFEECCKNSSVLMVDWHMLDMNFYINSFAPFYRSSIVGIKMKSSKPVSQNGTKTRHSSTSVPRFTLTSDRLSVQLDCRRSTGIT